MLRTPEFSFSSLFPRRLVLVAGSDGSNISGPHSLPEPHSLQLLFHSSVPPYPGWGLWRCCFIDRKVS